MDKLKDVMSRDVKVVGPDSSIREAAQFMRDGNFGLLPVVENDRMVGTISDRDIAVRGVAEGKEWRTKVRDVMSAGILWAYEDDSVGTALNMMSERQVRRLPVVRRQKRLVGIVALGDLAVERGDEKSAGNALSHISRPA